MKCIQECYLIQYKQLLKLELFPNISMTFQDHICSVFNHI